MAGGEWHGGRPARQHGRAAGARAGTETRDPARDGRLLARPRAEPAGTPVAPGMHRLAMDGEGDALLYVPRAYDAARPAPFVLALYGAGGDAEDGISPLLPLADEAGLILLAPSAQGGTWDMLRGGYGRDVAFIDRALERCFAHCAVDAAQVAIEGFSDGASYALSLGITNGDLFHEVIAFSPGFMAPVTARGRPRIFISHGTADPVLAIDSCSRRVVPRLVDAGYDVRFVEFRGGHGIPPRIAREAVEWMLGRSSGA